MLVRNIGMLAMAMTVASGSMSFAAQDVDTAMQSALSIGRVVGAAAGCPAIAKPRLKTVADRFNEAVAKWTADAREATSVKDGYDQGVTFAQRDISNRQIDCATADRELGVWEKNNFALSDSIPPATRTAAAAAPAPRGKPSSNAPCSARRSFARHVVLSHQFMRESASRRCRRHP